MDGRIGNGDYGSNVLPSPHTLALRAAFPCRGVEGHEVTIRQILALVFIGLLAACSGPSAEPSQATRPSTQTLAPTSQPEATDTEAPRPSASDSALQPCSGGEICTGSLATGEYTTDAVGSTTLTLEVTGEWEGEALPEAGLIALYPPDGSRSDIAAFRFTGEVFAEPCDMEAARETIEQTPEAMIEWLSAHPELEVGEPEQATLGEGTGLRIEITAAKQADCPSDQPVPPDWILLWVLPAVGDFHFNDGEEAVVYAVTVGEELVIVVAESVDSPDAFLPMAQAVVDSMVFVAD